jgi:pyruvyltransferase
MALTESTYFVPITFIPCSLGWKKVLDQISKCTYIISSSLHGIIVAEAFGVPARWLQIPGTETAKTQSSLKYDDYYISTGRNDVRPAASVEDAINEHGTATPAIEYGDGIGQVNLKAIQDSFPFQLF